MNRVLDPSSSSSQILSSRRLKHLEDHAQRWKLMQAISVIVLAFLGLLVVTIVRIALVIRRRKPEPARPKECKGHLLVVLGSGGHTAEMLNILRQLPDLVGKFPRRTYVVSSGDNFSALKALEFEKELENTCDERTESEVVTVTRARRVHQGITTAPFTTMLCLWDCLRVLRGKHPNQHLKDHTYPDLILTNGPGTGVCVVISAIILLLFGLKGPRLAGRKPGNGSKCYQSGEMRTIFIESWARVKTLSLSGRILKPIVDRFLVQWHQLVDQGGRAEYVGPLIA